MQGKASSANQPPAPGSRRRRRAPRIGRRALILRTDFMPLLGIEARGDFGRAYKITEQNR
jgi:hypothetical protein